MWHQVLVGRLHLSIATFLESRPHVGRIFLGPLDVVLSDRDVLEPDLLFVFGDQEGIVTRANVQRAPALAVEVPSPGTRKRRAREAAPVRRARVREYWLVDPVGRCVVVFRCLVDFHWAVP